jgi:hypothetical protein
MMKYLVFALFLVPFWSHAQFSVQLSGGGLFPLESAGQYYKPATIGHGMLSFDINPVYIGLGFGQCYINRKQPGYSLNENGNTFQVSLAERSRWDRIFAQVGVHVWQRPRFDLGIGLQGGYLFMRGTGFETVTSIGPFGTTSVSSTEASCLTYGPQLQFRYFVFPNVALSAGVDYLVYKNTNGDDFDAFQHPSNFLFGGTLGQAQVGLVIYRRSKKRD